MNARRFSLVPAMLVLTACGAPPKAPSTTSTQPAAAEWVTSESADLRKLTMAVRARPTPSLSALFEGLADRSEPPHASLYRATAAGGFGSGFALVRRQAGSLDPMVITNRHVIAFTDLTEIEDDTGRAKGAARVYYEDYIYDLAILKFNDTREPFRSGMGFEVAPAKDRQEVIATGFPGIGSRPSFQTTKGYVSNERFTLARGEDEHPHIQHTAPIDPGSSGGPLTTERGRLLGVNTFKVFGREGVAFAIPAHAVGEAVERADKAYACFNELGCRKKALVAACTATFLKLATESDDVSPAISPRLLAKRGMESLAWADTTSNVAVADLEEEDPLSAIRLAVTERLIAEFRGEDPSAYCSAPNPSDWDNLATVDRVRFALPTGQEAAFLWEHGHFKLSDIQFVRTQPKAASPSKGTKRKKRH